MNKHVKTRAHNHEFLYVYLGEWVLLFAHWSKYSALDKNNTLFEEDLLWKEKSFVERWHLEGLPKIAFFANLAGFGAFFGIGGFLQVMRSLTTTRVPPFLLLRCVLILFITRKFV
jgi:hypothetical protein